MDPSQNSLFKELESVHDSCLSQSQQDEEMQDLASQTVPQPSYGIQHHEIRDINTHKVEGIGHSTRKYVDSSNISLSSESTEYPLNLDEMASNLDNDAEPLQDMEISPEDFDDQSTQFMVFQGPNEIEQQFTSPVYHQGPLNALASVGPPHQPSSSSHHPVMNEQIQQPSQLPSSTGSSLSHDIRCNQMPADCEIHLRVSYMSSNNTIENSISQGDGFLLYHKKTPSPSLLPEKCKYVRFPEFKAELQSCSNVAKTEHEAIPLTAKDKTNIKHILDNMQGGLQVRCQDGRIFAKRWSKAKIFYYQCTAGGSLKELLRNNEVEIFNFYEYRKKVLEQYNLRSNNLESSVKDTNPVIYFTFAQKWVPGTVPLNKCLVWAKLTHSLAFQCWDGLLHPNENGNKGSLTNSYQGVLHFSNDSTEYNNVPCVSRNN